MAEEKERSERMPTRWDPFEELDIFRGWSPFREIGWPRLSRALERGVGRGALLPAVDIAEDDDRYVVTVEIPGANKNDVTVETDENVLTIRGEKKSEREEKKEQTRWVERTYGSFTRSFTLPANAQTERVAASFKDGVLTIEVPKRPEAKPRAISIKS
jgi:HSP20 family protein